MLLGFEEGSEKDIKLGGVFRLLDLEGLKGSESDLLWSLVKV